MASAGASMGENVFMTPDMVANMKRFQYSGEDKSLLYVHVLTPMNKRLINYVPMWLAPNLLTLIGFVFILSAHLLTLAYSPNFDEPLPAWLCVWCAVCFFAYQTIDNLDGSQVRPRPARTAPLRSDETFSFEQEFFVSIPTGGDTPRDVD